MNTPPHGSNIDRKSIPADCQWNIHDIYASQEEWDKACAGLKELIAGLETCQGSLKEPAILLRVLQLRDRLSQEIDKIYAYARLQQDVPRPSPEKRKDSWLPSIMRFRLSIPKSLPFRKNSWNN